MGYNMRHGYTDGTNPERRKPGLNQFVTGERVQIGFMRDLLVEGGGTVDGRRAVLLRSQKGVQYVFTPHEGITRVDGPELTVHRLVD